jgi:hypothetical protein
MKIGSTYLAVAMVVSLLGQPAAAAPSAAAVTSPQQAVSADIPFDPPLDSEVRYRWEKTEQRNGATEMSWSVDDYRFEQSDSGFRLTVTPVSSGSNETDPTKLAMVKRLDELTRRPFVLRLNESGEIEELEDADFYWATIFRVLKEEIAKQSSNKQSSKEKDAGLQQVMQNVFDMFQRMPAEARQALLTEEVQPIVEFSDTHTEVGKPLATAIETPSPYGGTINREVVISLNKVRAAKAYLTISSTIPRAELDKLMQTFLKQLTALPANKRKEAETVMASLEGFRHDTISDYEVSTEDGLLERFHSTQTIEVSDKGQEGRKITTRSMSRIR